jgi:exonuclease-1
MGISGLLPFLIKAHEKVPIASFKNQTIAIDGYVWLHRGLYSCGAEVGDHSSYGLPSSGIKVEAKQGTQIRANSWEGIENVNPNKINLFKKSPPYLRYAINRLQQLRECNIVPVMVLDGARLPAKAVTEEQRAMRREKAKEQSKEGKRGSMNAGIDVTPDMAHQLLLYCREQGIRSIVAPYEADAQLTYLARKGLVHAVLSEDSDLLAFGCPVLLVKWKGQHVTQIKRSNLFNGTVPRLRNWPHSLFTDTCIIAGCDYLPNLPGVGLITAISLMSNAKQSVMAVEKTEPDQLREELRIYDSDDDSQIYRSNATLKRMERLAKSRRISVPKDYINSVIDARLTFRHQRVYCPIKMEMVCLRPWVSHDRNAPSHLVGKLLPKELAQKIALGYIHPETHLPYRDGGTLALENEANRWPIVAKSIAQNDHSKIFSTEKEIGDTKIACPSECKFDRPELREIKFNSTQSQSESGGQSNFNASYSPSDMGLNHTPLSQASESSGTTNENVSNLPSKTVTKLSKTWHYRTLKSSQCCAVSTSPYFSAKRQKSAMEEDLDAVEVIVEYDDEVPIPKPNESNEVQNGLSFSILLYN